jgi:hypothetical protein
VGVPDRIVVIAIALVIGLLQLVVRGLPRVITLAVVSARYRP